MGIFEPDLARKSGGFICVLIGHLQGWFCHIFSGVPDSEIRGGMELRMAHPQQQENYKNRYHHVLIKIPVFLHLISHFSFCNLMKYPISLSPFELVIISL